jgi:muramoyltetrapeptide carboxypeptidase
MLVVPPPLAPGEIVAVVGPSSPFPRDPFLQGLAWLRARYRVRIRPDIFARTGYLAGDDARRASELADVMCDGEVKAIVAARGGYGAMRLLDGLPWAALARRPKWIVGFSDVTALHATAWAAGIASVHGPNVTGLGNTSLPRTRARWLGCLERPDGPRAWSGLRVVHRGEGTGPVVGGNLAVVHAMAAAGRLRVPRGAVLVLEDVNEAPYRVDRMLTSLRLGGHLEAVSAIVFGEFDRCVPGPDGRTLDEVLEERTCNLGVAVLSGAPFGHGARNDAFVVGMRARVSDGTVTFG